LETLLIWKEQSNGIWVWEAPVPAGASVVLVICSSSIPDNTRKHSSNVAEVMVGSNTVVLLLVLLLVLLVLVDSFSLFVDEDEAVAVMLLWWSFSYQPPQW
jgi:hypothetical protein